MAAMEEERRKEEAQLQQVLLQHNRILMNINVSSTLKQISNSNYSTSSNTNMSEAAPQPAYNPDS